MADRELGKPSRRRMLYVAAGSMAGVGALAALWPLIDAMNPSGDVRASIVVVDLDAIEEGGEVTVAWQGLPVFVSKRTPGQLAALRSSSSSRVLRDPTSTWSEQPLDAKNWHRSLRPEIGVFVGTCTRGDCVVHRQGSASPDARYLCPCCGAAYDFAGQIFSGPAPRNLRVPPHRLIAARELLIGAG